MIEQWKSGDNCSKMRLQGDRTVKVWRDGSTGEGWVKVTLNDLGFSASKVTCSGSNDERSPALPLS